MYRIQWSWNLKMCPYFIRCCVHASMELGPEDVSPIFIRCYVHASMELGPEDVSLFHQVLCTAHESTCIQ